MTPEERARKLGGLLCEEVDWRERANLILVHDAQTWRLAIEDAAKVVDALAADATDDDEGREYANTCRFFALQIRALLEKP